MVVPCFNEQESLQLFYEEVLNVIPQMPEVSVDFLFVNDGSADNTLNTIKGLAETDDSVSYISLSRNFGKEAAVFVGLKYAKGDYVAVIDADLQDPPHLIPQMIQLVKNGECDCVATRRVSRKGEPVIRSFCARVFYKIMQKVFKVNIADGTRDYRLMNRKFVNALLSMGEYNRFFKGMADWVGFKTKWLEYENVVRASGETKWTFWKLFKYSIDGIVAFSTAPLVVASLVGVICCFLALAFTVFIVVRKLVFGDPVTGWASIVCIILFLGGIQMLGIGILGEYLAKTYMETKNRPIFIIDETNLKK